MTETHNVRDALRLILVAYRLAERSTPANLRRAILDAERVLNAEAPSTTPRRAEYDELRDPREGEP